MLPRSEIAALNQIAKKIGSTSTPPYLIVDNIQEYLRSTTLQPFAIYIENEYVSAIVFHQLETDNIPDVFDAFTRLKRLFLVRTNINIPFSLQHSKLHHLIFITADKQELPVFENIKLFNALACRWTKIPETLLQMHQLTSVSIILNRELHTVDSRLFELPHLEHLSLVSNNIAVLPDKIKSPLRILNIEFNKIEYPPKWLHTIPEIYVTHAWHDNHRYNQFKIREIKALTSTWERYPESLIDDIKLHGLTHSIRHYPELNKYFDYLIRYFQQHNMPELADALLLLSLERLSYKTEEYTILL